MESPDHGMRYEAVEIGRFVHVDGAASAQIREVARVSGDGAQSSFRNLFARFIHAYNITKTPRATQAR